MEEKKLTQEPQVEESQEKDSKKVVIQFRKLEKLETTVHQRPGTGADAMYG